MKAAEFCSYDADLHYLNEVDREFEATEMEHIVFLEIAVSKMTASIQECLRKQILSSLLAQRTLLYIQRKFRKFNDGSRGREFG